MLAAGGGRAKLGLMALWVVSRSWGGRRAGDRCRTIYGLRIRGGPVASGFTRLRILLSLLWSLFSLGPSRRRGFRRCRGFRWRLGISRRVGFNHQRAPIGAIRVLLLRQEFGLVGRFLRGLWILSREVGSIGFIRRGIGLGDSCG